jgi:glycosyltransferase involved in cell wall biosynthesis
VAIEPAVYSKPVIASACGGLVEIVKDGDTGFLVPPSDSNALADRISRLISSPDLVRALGERACTDYKARFDEPVFIEQYRRIVDSVIGR